MKIKVDVMEPPEKEVRSIPVSGKPCLVLSADWGVQPGDVFMAPHMVRGSCSPCTLVWFLCLSEEVSVCDTNYLTCASVKWRYLDNPTITIKENRSDE